MRIVVKKKEKVFRGTIAPDGRLMLLLLALPAIPLGTESLILIRDGRSSGTVLAILSVAFALVGWLRASNNMRKRVRVTPDLLIYEHNRKEIVMRWSQIKKLIPPGDFSTRFRTLRVSDGKQEICIDSASFKEFDLLVSLVTVAHKHSVRSRDNTYVMNVSPTPTPSAGLELGRA